MWTSSRRARGPGPPGRPTRWCGARRRANCGAFDREDGGTPAIRTGARSARRLGARATEWPFVRTTIGLRLFPRDEQLLRSQALALGDLDAGALDAAHIDEARLEAAHGAFVRYRRPDDETQLRLACEQHVEGCARDRLPVPVIELR